MEPGLCPHSITKTCEVAPRILEDLYTSALCVFMSCARTLLFLCAGQDSEIEQQSGKFCELILPLTKELLCIASIPATEVQYVLFPKVGEISEVELEFLATGKTP
jgi:hypothetical protein